MKSKNLSGVTCSLSLKVIMAIICLFSTFDTALAADCAPETLRAQTIARVAMQGAKVVVSAPVSVHERQSDSRSAVIGYALQYYIEFSPQHGVRRDLLGRLYFQKTGDSCVPGALSTAEVETSIVIPLEALKAGD